jgi:hypothetical protein
MVDEKLLGMARGAAARLAEAEREALLARADYHTAIRRMHLAGASLREVGEAVGISHQRVQQIVESAGGSWWQRVWKTRRPRRDAVCTFCGGAPGDVAKLIAGPDVYVCDGCVAALGRATRKSRGPCSFCGKRGAVRLEAGGPGVCADCLRTCREIIG